MSRMLAMLEPAGLLRAVFFLGVLRRRLDPLDRLEGLDRLGRLRPLYYRKDRGRLGVAVVTLRHRLLGLLRVHHARRGWDRFDPLGLDRPSPDLGLGRGTETRQRGVGSCLIGWETVSGRIGQVQQLTGQLARVLDDPVALGPDPVGLGIELGVQVLGACVVIFVRELFGFFC